jgi:hypothetical protein
MNKNCSMKDMDPYKANTHTLQFSEVTLIPSCPEMGLTVFIEFCHRVLSLQSIQIQKHFLNYITFLVFVLSNYWFSFLHRQMGQLSRYSAGLRAG